MKKEMLQLILIFSQYAIMEAINQDTTAVMLGSTLKQGALCPGDRTATITCTAVGTDLIWLVDERMMSYNANARVGAIRSNAQSDQTSILMRVESRGDDSGVASRMSVLTISELPSARAPLTVACHNGSEVGEDIRFWRRQAGTLGMPTVNTPKRLGTAGGIQLNWTAPDVYADLQVIDYYLVQIDDRPPTLVKNSSAVVFVEQGTNHTIKVQAVDICNQRGSESLTLLPLLAANPMGSPPTPLITQEPLATFSEEKNGARKGIEVAVTVEIISWATIMKILTWQC